ncbi:hypothetical protein AN958_01859 [Leucoagaricus sp. SymC.cos]|nr:hypothetical protein AN958_01859 [Leucoagaricus sp. SymC.cos]
MVSSSDLRLVSAVTLVNLTTVNGALFGLGFALFCLCVQSLCLQLKDSDRRGQKICTLVHMFLVLACGLLNLAMDARGMQVSYIDHVDDFKGGGYMYHAYVYNKQPIGIGSEAVPIVLDCLLLGIQIWRLWVIYSTSRYAIPVVALPTLALVAYVAIECYLVIIPLAAQAQSKNVATAAVSLIFTHELLVTLCIVGHIVAFRRKQTKLMGQATSGSQYTTVIAILVESFALSSAWVIADIITSVAVSTNIHRESAFLFLEGSRQYIQTISYFLVFYRVVTGRAWKKDTEQKLTSLEWNRGPQTTGNIVAISEIPQSSRSAVATQV